MVSPRIFDQYIIDEPPELTVIGNEIRNSISEWSVKIVKKINEFTEKWILSAVQEQYGYIPKDIDQHTLTFDWQLLEHQHINDKLIYIKELHFRNEFRTRLILKSYALTNLELHYIIEHHSGFRSEGCI